MTFEILRFLRIILSLLKCNSFIRSFFIAKLIDIASPYDNKQYKYIINLDLSILHFNKSAIQLK